MANTALILGIGNTLLGDDGAGVHALARVAARLGERPDVALVDGGTLSFTLLPMLDGCARLIVLDAADLGLPPGTVRAFEGRAMDELLGRPGRSVHEVGLRDVLDMARLTGTLPGSRALVGIQPARIDWKDAPYPEVATALDEAAGLAIAILDRWTPDRASPAYLDTCGVPAGAAAA